MVKDRMEGAKEKVAFRLGPASGLIDKASVRLVKLLDLESLEFK